MQHVIVEEYWVSVDGKKFVSKELCESHERFLISKMTSFFLTSFPDGVTSVGLLSGVCISRAKELVSILRDVAPHAFEEETPKDKLLTD